MSGDKNFRPSDIKFAPDGSLYLADWQNVIIGHMQHNVRDPNRDHAHGRIYRITATGRPTCSKPVAIAGQPIPDAARCAQSTRPTASANARESNSAPEIPRKSSRPRRQWMKQFDATKKEDAHHLLEALWLSHRSTTSATVELLGQHCRSLPSPTPATPPYVVQHLWFNVESTLHGGVIAGDAEEKLQKSGILSDTPNSPPSASPPSRSA